MTYNLSSNFSNGQRFHQFALGTPEGTLTRWAVNKIDSTYEKQYSQLSHSQARLIRGVIVAAMPVFALFDMIGCIGKALFHLTVLKPKTAMYDLLGCAKSVQLFFTTLPFMVIAQHRPGKYYKSQKTWSKIAQSNIQRQASKEKVNSKESFNKFLKKHINKNVLDSDSQKFFHSIRNIMQKEIPVNNDDEELIVNSYINLYSLMLTTCELYQIKLSVNDSGMMILFEQIITLKKPNLRTNLIDNVLSILGKGPSHFNKLSDMLNKFDKENVTSYFLVLQITENEDLISRFKKVISAKAFNKRSSRKNNLRTQLNLLIKSDVTEAQKERLFELLIDSAEKEPFKNPSEKTMSKLYNTIKGNKKDLKGITDKISNSEKELKNLENSEQKNQQKINKLQKDIEQFKEKQKNLESRIQKNETDVKAYEEIKKYIEKGVKISGSYLDNSITVLSMILRLNDEELKKQLIENIGPEKDFPVLFDMRIIEKILRNTFEIEPSLDIDLDKLDQMRDITALIKHRQRLQRDMGDSEEKTQLLKVSKDILIAYLQGKYQDLRMSEDDNLHLKTIFEKFPDLKQKWVNPITQSVGNLYPKASKKYKNHTIQVLNDPSDIFSIGMDHDTCLSLDNGGPERMRGLTAYGRDGKTHVVVAKSRDKSNKLNYAHALLQLLWDKKNEKPILLLNGVYDLEPNTKSRDDSLEHAIIKYAKDFAKELDVDVVASQHYEKFSKGGELYDDGNVVSLGSSCPVEYVDSLYDICYKEFSVEKTYKIA